jgi:hypothetical protein
MECEPYRTALYEKESHEELPPDVLAHLDACPACRRLAERLARLGRWARSIVIPEPSPDVLERLRSNF